MSDKTLSHWTMVGVKKQFMPKLLRNMTPTEIRSAVCVYFGITETEIRTKSRKRAIVYARQIAIYLICNNTRLNLIEVVEYFTPALAYDHSNIINSRDKITEYLSQKYPRNLDNPTRKDLENIERSVTNFVFADN